MTVTYLNQTRGMAWCLCHTWKPGRSRTPGAGSCRVGQDAPRHSKGQHVGFRWSQQHSLHCNSHKKQHLDVCACVFYRPCLEAVGKLQSIAVQEAQTAPQSEFAVVKPLLTNRCPWLWHRHCSQVLRWHPSRQTADPVHGCGQVGAKKSQTRCCYCPHS